MEITTVDISKKYKLDGTATLKCFIHKADGEMKKYSGNRDAIIVVPGGGYHFCSEREGDPIATEFYTYNYNAFVLEYNHAGNDGYYPLSLMQLACAVDYVKKNAHKLGINKKRVFVVGFSAGGHLTGTLSAFCDNLPEKDGWGRTPNARPTAVVLSYPVIMIESHRGSFRNLLNLTDEQLGSDGKYDHLAELLSLEQTVTPETPPTFIWTTAQDKCVDPIATIEYTRALYQNGVLYESHIFPYGGHGGATCDERTCTAGHGVARATVWMQMADAFLKSVPSLKTAKKQ